MNILFEKGMAPNVCPYPIKKDQLDKLENCRLVNPKIGKNYGLKLPDDWNIVKAAKEVLQVRLDVLNDIYPREFLEKYWPYNFKMPDYLPKAFEIEGLSFDDPKGLADVVHMDDPLDFPLAQKKVISNPKYGGYANIKNKEPRYINFLETVVDVNETITDFQKRYGHRVFELKYYLGVARPEEVLDFLGVKLTAYPEGCPNHPAIGQGHLALSQAGILALHKEFDLDEDQIKDMLYASYLWGQFRCLAGVHYAIDGILSILLVGGFDKYLDKKFVNEFKIK